MKRKNTFIVIILVAMAIFILPNIGLFTTTPEYDYFRSGTCSQVSQEKLNGAQVGECWEWVSSINNYRGKILYLTQLLEGSKSCSVSPSCPDGLKPTCQTDSSPNWYPLCDVVHMKDGSIKKVCKYDSDCPSGDCGSTGLCSIVSHYCSKGETRCLGTAKYQKCLSQDSWSGLLACSSGTTCSGDRCKTSQEIIDENVQDSLDNLQDSEIPLDTTILITLGGLFALVLLLMKGG